MNSLKKATNSLKRYFIFLVEIHLCMPVSPILWQPIVIPASFPRYLLSFLLVVLGNTDWCSIIAGGELKNLA